MSRCISLAFAGATGLAAILMPVPDASAMPPTIATQFAGAGILTVGGACNAYSCRNYSGLYWMPYYVGDVSPYYKSLVPAYTACSAHVSYCLNRYRTYNPATNQYHAGGGIHRACLSPYR
jgi:hypothetical protein